MTYKVLFISDIPIFNITNQIGIRVLEETLKMFDRNDYNVYVIAPQLDGKRRILRYSKNIVIISYSLGIIGNLSQIKGLSYISKWILFILSVILLRRKAFKKVFDKRFDFVYGVGPLGSLIAKKIGDIKGIPVIARYLGVASTYERFNIWYKRFLCYPDIYSYRKHYDFIVMTDDGTRGDEFLKHINTKTTKILFIRNGLNKGLFENVIRSNYIREQLNLPMNIKTILVVSRLSKLKRVDRSIYLFYSLCKYRDDIRLIIIGNGSEKQRLKRLVLKLGIDHTVFFLEAKPHEELINYYSSSDLFFSFYDTSNAGNPLFEAMQTGNCIVTLNTGETKKFLKKDAGVVLNSTTSNLSFQLVNNLLNDNDLRVQMGMKAKALADKEIFDWKVRINVELNNIKDIILGKWA